MGSTKCNSNMARIKLKKRGRNYKMRPHFYVEIEV